MTPNIDLKERLSALSRPLSVAVTSGKGGAGKSVIALSLAAVSASRGIRTLLIDADLGLGNQHIMMNKTPVFTLEDVLCRSCGVDEAVLGITDSLSLIAARSGFADAEFNVALTNADVIAQLLWLRENFDLIVIDSAAGISPKVAILGKLTDLMLMVTTPDIAAVADSYALTKYQVSKNSSARIGLVINRVEDERVGKKTSDNFRLMARRFMGYELDDAAVICESDMFRSASLYRNALGTANVNVEWSEEVDRVAYVMVECIPDNLSQWPTDRWDEARAVSLLNIGRENDDTLNMAFQAGGHAVSAERELLTPRKDSV